MFRTGSPRDGPGRGRVLQWNVSGRGEVPIRTALMFVTRSCSTREYLGTAGKECDRLAYQGVLPQGAAGTTKCCLTARADFLWSSGARWRSGRCGSILPSKNCKRGFKGAQSLGAWACQDFHASAGDTLREARRRLKAKSNRTTLVLYMQNC